VLIVIGALMLTMLLAALDQTIVSTALPTIVGGRAEAGTIAADALKTRDPADGVILRQALGQLRTRGLVESSDPPARLTASGQEIRGSLMSARQRSLEYLVADWQPEDPRVDAMIVRLSEELAHSGQA